MAAARSTSAGVTEPTPERTMCTRHWSEGQAASMSEIASKLPSTSALTIKGILISSDSAPFPTLVNNAV